MVILLSGAIFEQGTEEVQSAFKYALANHNQNNTRRFDLMAFADVINTADAFKLSRLSEYTNLEWNVKWLISTMIPLTKAGEIF